MVKFSCNACQVNTDATKIGPVAISPMQFGPFPIGPVDLGDPSSAMMFFGDETTTPPKKSNTVGLAIGIVAGMGLIVALALSGARSRP